MRATSAFFRSPPFKSAPAPLFSDPRTLKNARRALLTARRHLKACAEHLKAPGRVAGLLAAPFFLRLVEFSGQKWSTVVERLANKVKSSGGQRTDGACPRQGRRQRSSQSPR